MYAVGVAYANCETGQPEYYGRVVKIHIQRLLRGAMGRAADYRQRAAEFRANGRPALTREAAKEFYELADRYIRLAEQAERNDMTDLVYEPPPPKKAE